MSDHAGERIWPARGGEARRRADDAREPAAEALAREDDALARRAREGDPRALAVLYRRHAPALLAYLARVVRDRAAAEDILHDTFLRLFEARGGYEARGRFRPWLFRVATRLALDRGRDERRRSVLLEEAGALVAPAPPSGPDEDLRRREIGEAIEAALADLPPSYAATFHLRVAESLSYGEIAAIRGEPEGTLRSRVHHAVQRIRALVRAAGRTRPTEREETIE